MYFGSRLSGSGVTGMPLEGFIDGFTTFVTHHMRWRVIGKLLERNDSGKAAIANDNECNVPRGRLSGDKQKCCLCDVRLRDWSEFGKSVAPARVGAEERRSPKKIDELSDEQTEGKANDAD